MPGDFEAVFDRLDMPWPISVRVASPSGPMIALQLSVRETTDLASALVAVLDAAGLAAVDQAITERRAALEAAARGQEEHSG